MAIESDQARRDLMRLALEHRAQLWGFLMGLTKDPQKAEDLFQNTYLILCEKWDQYRPGTNFMAWARQIARYEFLASVDPGRRPFVTAEIEVLDLALQATERREAPSLRRDALRRCLDQLPDARGRRVLELRYGEGLSGERVARAVDLSLNALYTLLSRVRRSLQDCVEKRLRVEEAGA